MDNRDRVAEVIEHRKRSHAWMRDSFYQQWISAYQAYICECEPRTDPNTGRADPDRITVASPNTWAGVNRDVARVTAQPPNLHYRANNKTIGELISLKLMYDWDRGRIQIQQPRHVRQAAIFGWSVRSWSWERSVMWRSKRVSIDQELQSAQQGQGLGLAAIADFYSQEIQAIAPGFDPLEAIFSPEVRAMLVARRGRGGLVPVKYRYVAYDGPRADYLFVGDCFPEPNFQSLRGSKWFIVERRRSKGYLLNLARVMPDLQAGVEALIAQYPSGSPKRNSGNGNSLSLRFELESVAGIAMEQVSAGDQDGDYTITEEHRPGAGGETPTITLIGEDSVHIGTSPYPYDLDGNIAFTECRLIDNLLHGVGDSAPRIMRGLQSMHSTLMSRRWEAYDFALRPLFGTTDKGFYDNPERLKRMDGYRVMHMTQGPNSVWVQDTNGLLGAAQASQAEDGNLARAVQMITGDSNMSMMAGVDPQASRTATGARIVQSNLDALTRSKIEVFTQASLVEDAWMLYRLNRSELTEAAEIETGSYARGPIEGRAVKDEWARVEPLMFQEDGQIVVESGSTLADDDDARMERATALYGALKGHPDIDQRRLAMDLLIAHGKGSRISDYMVKQLPPGEGNAAPARTSISVAAKLSELPPIAQEAILAGHGILPKPEQPQGPGGPPQDPGADQMMQPPQMEGPIGPDQPQ